MAFVEVTKKDHIAVVTMNRPEALNALNDEPFEVAFSAGWAEFGKEGRKSVEAVLAAADRHMYAIKSVHERSRGGRR